MSKQVTCRHAKLNLVQTHYSPDVIKETRNLLGISQHLFARFLGVSPNTVQSWEQGVNPPCPMACRFMDEIRQDPTYWIKRLQELQTNKKQTTP